MNYTDEQIIKALKCCVQVDTDVCDVCPLYDKESGCLEVDIRVPALNLINRLKAENEKLTIELKAMRGSANSYKSEVERLEAQHREMCIGMKVLKKKALKEFAERFREKASSSVMSCQGYEIYETKQYQISAVDFDNLLEEMEKQ